MLVMLTACSMHEDYPEWCDAPVAVSLAFTVSDASNGQTRALPSVVQDNGFRGIQELNIIPFDVRGRLITSTDSPKLFSPEGATATYDGTNSKYFYYNDCTFMQGVASFLTYGRATPYSDNKAVNGSLDVTFPVDRIPAGISFSPTTIYESAEIPADAQLIADYLNRIAKTEGWSTASDSHLQAYYQNFIGQGSAAPSVIAGSSANVKAYVADLKGLLEDLTDNDELRTAIIANIDNTGSLGSTADGTLPDNYPASIGLPDGAAALRWEIPSGKTEPEFVPQTVTTTEAYINSLSRFAYPAELYYYGNSQIRTSSIDNRQVYYNNSAWSAVLESYEYDDAVVTTNTRAVAIKNPVQYAVARLDATIKAEHTSLLDARKVAVGISNNAFPLTAVIVGGQRPVGFDFKPTESSETNVRFVYDKNVAASYSGSTPTPFYLSTEERGPISTLLLQSYDGLNETIILEFTNNSNTDFMGIDGIIYRGTKFYLIGIIELETPTEVDYTKRVFTQDYTTTVKMKVESLAKAYNVLPNLLSPRLEIGVQLTTKWEQTTPTNVVLP